MPFADYITSPTSFRNAQANALVGRNQMSFTDQTTQILKKPPRHSQHPNFGHLTLLVFEAVLEVVCVSLPGYIVARMGMFEAESQKFLANLNVQLFTPCLIFTKLASQLTAEKLVELAIIPFIFIVQTLVSYLCSWILAKCLGFNKRQKNFIIAMGVFGNSNSLPISLVISLSQTLKGLHWDKVPGDNDNEVGARGILYLLIFQQLGQLLRWSWGYNVLLAPANKYTEEEGGTKVVSTMEGGQSRYPDEPEDESQQRLLPPAYDRSRDSDSQDDDRTRIGDSPTIKSSGVRTPGDGSRPSSRSSFTPHNGDDEILPTPANGNIAPHYQHNLSSLVEIDRKKVYDEDCGGVKGYINQLRNSTRHSLIRAKDMVDASASQAFSHLPNPLQVFLTHLYHAVAGFLFGLWEFMNPPLWSMLIAIVVASVPKLQHAFFDDGTFIRNSVSRAIAQSGGVAVPLILVVLGGNLARNTLPKATNTDIVDPKEERKLLIVALISRMLLPTIIMAPLLALTAKYIPVSIVDDKIFVIVCFLLTGAPTALQLAQICQVNNVYMSVMSKILFQSYVVWILPSTLILVMLALEVVEWATPG